MCARSAPKLDLKPIGRRIRALRAEMRQQQFAAQLGISQGQLSKIERGEVAPTLEVLLVMAIKSGRTIDWIVRSDEK
jgi:transcriptional regulator with XRE-family HTH domain